MSLKEEAIFYFAYGSNMNPDRMNNRKAHYTQRELGKLPGYRLVFNKTTQYKTSAANIVPDPDSVVYGACYTGNNDTLVTLDEFECVAEGHYRRECVDVILVSGETRKAITYIANQEKCDDTIKDINRWYLDHLLAGKDILPFEYFQFLKSFQPQTV